MRAKAIMIAVAMIWLGGCTEQATLVSSEGVLPEELLDGIAVNRIGRDRIGLGDNQDRAMAKAVAFAVERGVDRERITTITIDTTGGEVRRRLGTTPRRTPVRYTIWLRIEGCETRVVFNANATGRIAAPTDRSGCLSAAETPGQ